jgi:GT2 family glycosyltransferase
MKRALIATVFNEANSVPRWVDALRAQTVHPDEFVIVDGGSTDGTPDLMRKLFAAGGFPPPRIIVQRCNIAEGRNIAIRQTDAEIIAANDAGSSPEPEWFGEITRPLLSDEKPDVVGGRSVSIVRNVFQESLQLLDPESPEPSTPDEVYPSSRNIAFRRQAWADVGGYPEWLTLTAEDALFNFELHKIGKRFAYNPRARVTWPVRETAEDYFRMLYSYGYGAAEARLYAPYFLRRALITTLPPVLLLSRHRFRHLGFRYRKNLASTRGWLAGWIRGHRPPPGWKRVDGVLLSLEAQKHLLNKTAVCPDANCHPNHPNKAGL